MAQLIVALGIYAYAYLAPAPFSGVTRASDTVLHAIGSGILFLSFYVATRESLGVWAIMALACFVSFCFEYAQSFTNARMFDGADLVMNALGVCIGGVVIGACSRLGWLERA